MVNPARANDQDDLFTTGTAGLPEVRGADVIRLELRADPFRHFCPAVHEYVLVESGTFRLTEVWSGWLVLTTRRRSGC
jgi:hypothetical protein